MKKPILTWEVFTENYSFTVQAKNILGAAMASKNCEIPIICIQQADRAELLTGPKIAEAREAFANYKYTEGCSCCQDIDGHEAALNVIGKLLDCPKYSDDSGYDFYQFRKGVNDGNV